MDAVIRNAKGIGGTTSICGDPTRAVDLMSPVIRVGLR